MAIHVQELNHIALHVRDLETSIHFYEHVLGLLPLPRPAFSFPGAWFALGAQELHLIADPDLTSGEKRHHLALRVDDPMDARRQLESKGVAGLQGPAPRPDGAMQLFLSDPDGYVIELLGPLPT